MPPEIVYQAKGERITRPLEGDELVIGRLPECHIVITDTAVSRRHARIFRDGDSWRVADLGSRNGTLVNDTACLEQVLQNGDKIRIHDTVLIYRDDRAPGRREATYAGGVQDPGARTVFRSAVDFASLASASPTLAPVAAAAPDRLHRLVRIATEASGAVLAVRSLDEIFQRMLDLVFEHLPVQRGFILLWDQERAALQVRCVKDRSAKEGLDQELRFSRTIAERVCREKVGVLTTDAQADERFASGESIVALGTRSAMAAPVWRGEAVDGLIYVDSSLVTKAFDAFDLDLLSALGNHLAVALEQSRLQQVAIQKERLDRELAVARQIQMAVLPKRMPRLDGYDLAGASLPAEETGGDIFDLVPLDPSRLMILLGDATGHGIGPALSVTQVRAMLRMAIRLGADLDSAFTHINAQLTQDLADNRFVTAFLGLLDSRTHRIEYHSGGQGPLLHFHAAGATFEWRGSSVMPLGFTEKLALGNPQEIALAPGDILALITDGLFEYENASGEPYGRERAAEVIAKHHDRPMSELLDRLLTAVRSFSDGASQGDDLTIVLVRRLGSQPA